MFEKIFGTDIKKKIKILRDKDPNFLDLNIITYQRYYSDLMIDNSYKNISAEIYFYNDRIEINHYNKKIENIIIPYNKIKSLKNYRLNIKVDFFIIGSGNIEYSLEYYDDQNNDQTIIINYMNEKNALFIRNKSVLELRWNNN